MISTYPTTQSYRMVRVYGREFLASDIFDDRRVVAFFEKVAFDHGASGCWFWNGSKDQFGYGKFRVGAKSNGRPILAMAHRVSWQILRGYIENGFHLHHQIEQPTCCIGPNCVNPDHLQPVSAADHVFLNPANIAVINTYKTHCLAGHELTPENIYIPPGTGKRRCKICIAEWSRQQYQITYKAHPRERPTHCPRGHPYDADNGYEYNGRMQCRACHAALTARQYHEKKNARGIHTGPRILFADRTECKRGHNLTLPDAIYRFLLHGQPKSCCRICKEEAHRATYDKWKLAHANDPKPEPRKRGPKPRIQAAGVQIH